MIDPSAKRKLQGYLQPGERLLWTARPPALQLIKSQLPGLLFGWVWAFVVIGIFPNIAAFSGKGLMALNVPQLLQSPLSLFLLIPLVFLVIALWILISSIHVILSCWTIHYGISDKRVLILSAMPPRRLHSYLPHDLGSIERSGNDIRGSIILGSGQLSRQSRKVSLGRHIINDLIAIRNPKRVEALVMDLTKQRTA